MSVRPVLVLLAATFLVSGPLAGQSVEERNKAVFHSMVEAVNARDLDALDDLMVEDLVRHSQATAPLEVRSLEDFKAFLETDFAAVPDSRQECPIVIAEGDYVAAWCEYAGTQQGAMGPLPPTGKPMRLDFAGFLRFEEGRIAEMWVIWDNLTAMAQLGHWPPPGPPSEGERP